MHRLLSSSGIRGLAIRDISPELCMRVGLSISGKKRGEYVIGHDTRISSPLLADSLIDGLNAGGSDSIFLGLVPTPAVAYYSKRFSGGVAVTASHNPPEYNGLKIFDERGASVPTSFYEEILSAPSQRYARWDSLGSRRDYDGLHEYIQFLSSFSDTRRRWRVGLDPGNGATALTAPLVFRLCGHEVEAVNLAPDGNFPGRGPEPIEPLLLTLAETIRKKSLDIGFAYDGDGDRFAILDENGRFLSQDLALGQMARFYVERHGGPIVVNVDSSSIIDFLVKSAGGEVVRSRVGDPFVVEEIIKSNAVFGGEACGAWIFPRIFLCPDGVLSSILFLNFLDSIGAKASHLRSNLPSFFLERAKLPCRNELKEIFMGKLRERLIGIYPEAEPYSVDGLRLSWRDFTWALIRPSGTEPIIRITVESTDKEKTKGLINSITKHSMEIMEGLKRRG
ncbi:MAG: phosphoglucosamine mutase [Candidatus Methanomethylicaceae archaeon]